MPPQRLAFLGFGEVAATFYASGLADVSGLEVTACIPNHPPQQWGVAHDNLAQADLITHEDPSVLGKAETVISLVQPKAAVSVAQKAAPYLKEGMLYVDMNSIAYPTAIEVGAIVSRVGAKFVDAAILGPVPLLKLEVPIVLAGPWAGDFHELAAGWGFHTRILSDRAGDASALKMLWSVITKGAIAIFAEALVAAQRMDLDESLRDLLREDFGRFGSDSMVLRLLRSTAQSGKRRLGEMEEVRRTLEAVDVPSWAVGATQRWIESIAGIESAAQAQRVEDVLEEISDGLSQ